MRKRRLYTVQTSLLVGWKKKTPQTEKLKQKALLGDLADELLLLHTVLKGALPVVSKVLSLPSFFSLFLLEAFRQRSSAKYRLASSVQFQAASQLPAPYVENTREWLRAAVTHRVSCCSPLQSGVSCSTELADRFGKVSALEGAPCRTSTLHWDCLPAHVRTQIPVFVEKCN